MLFVVMPKLKLIITNWGFFPKYMNGGDILGWTNTMTI